MKRVENEHLVKLQQLEKMKVEQDKVFDFTKGEKQNNDNDDAVICNASISNIFFITHFIVCFHCIIGCYFSEM